MAHYPKPLSLCDRYSDAAKAGNLSAIQALLDQAPPPNSAEFREGFTPLCEAAVHGHADCLMALIPHYNPRAAAEGCDGLTPLMLAALNGNSECISALLPHSDLGAKDSNGNTALMHAVLYGHESGAIECVLLLLPLTPRNSTDSQGYSPLMRACCDTRDSACAQALIASSDLRATDKQGRTAFDIAAQTGSRDCVDLLLPFFSHDQNALKQNSRYARDQGRSDISDRIDASR